MGWIIRYLKEFQYMRIGKKSIHVLCNIYSINYFKIDIKAVASIALDFADFSNEYELALYYLGDKCWSIRREDTESIKVVRNWILLAKSGGGGFLKSDNVALNYFLKAAKERLAIDHVLIVPY